MGEFNSTGYSADVRIWLVCADRRIRLSHAASTFVIAAEPQDVPACDGRIEFSIDGETFERPVTLVRGMSKTNREAPVYARDHVAPF